MTCNRCSGTGWLNTHQLPNGVDAYNHQEVSRWVDENNGHDIAVCDCCSDGKTYYGQPGYHYADEDPRGIEGPYRYNGGLAECH